MKFKNKLKFLIPIFILGLTTISIQSCKKETKNDDTEKKNDPTTQSDKDFFKIADYTFGYVRDVYVSTSYSSVTKGTELRLANKKGGDSTLVIYHDTVLVNHPCKSGMGFTLKDSVVRFNGRIGVTLSSPVISTEQSNNKYGSYVIKLENGRKVSYFSGIDLVDTKTNKRYICEGRITWPE